MKQLFVMEWRKARQFDRYMWIWLILLGMVPLLLYLKIGTVYLGDDFLPGKYLETVQGISGMAPEEAVQALTEQMIAEDMVYSPEKRVVLQEVEEAAGYGEYLERIQSGGPGGLPGFQEQDYQSRLKEKYKKVYAGLSSDEVMFAAGRGIYLFLQTDIMDGVIVLLLMLYVFRLITSEYETDITALLCCTRNGTRNTVRVKWLLGAILLSLSVICVLSVKLIAYAWSYHFCTWQGMIQSIPGYQAVEKPVSVAVFLILFFCCKVIGYLFLYTVLFFMAVKIRESRLFFIAGVCAAAVSFYLMAGIHVSDRGGFFSLLSPLRCIDQSRMLAGYQAVNILGYPVWYQGLYGVLAGVLFLWILALVWRSSMRLPGSGRVGSVCRRKIKRRTAVREQKGKRFLLLWEIRKNLMIEKGLFLLLAAVMVTVFLYQAPEDQMLQPEDYYYRDYIRKFAGPYSDTKQEKIKETCRELQLLSEDMEKNGDRYTDTASSVAVEELVKQKPAQQVLEYGEYLAEYRNAAFVYEKGYYMLLGADIPGSYLRLCDVLGILLMAVLGTGMWGMEQWQGMEAICNSCRCDMRKLYHYKWMLNGIYAFLVAAVAYGRWFWLVSETFGLQEWTMSAASLRQFSAFAGLDLGGLVLFTYLIRMLYLFLVGALGKGIQRKLHSRILSVSATAVLAMIPLWFIM